MAVPVRTTSLVASVGMLGAAVIAALTMSITLQPPPPGIDGGVIDLVPEQPPPPPSPVIRRTTPPPESTDVADEPPTQIAQEPQTTVINVPYSDPGPTIETITRPHWLHRPSDLQIYYPRRALQSEIDGDVVLDCQVSIAGALRCSVVAESPEQWGFGAAALRIAADHRMEPAIRGGVAVEGIYRMRVPFRVD